MSAHLVGVTPEMQQLAESSPDTSEHRQDEPYRRALTGVYARLAATLQAAHVAARPRATPWHRKTPMATPPNSWRDLRTIAASLQAHHGAALAAPRLQPLIRAVEVFGFHLATVDLRQSSDQHERVVAELLAVARIEPDYAALPEEARRGAADAPAAATRGRCASWARSTRRTPRPSWRSSRPRGRCASATARTRSATTSSATPKRSATCSKCCCCKRKWA